MSLRSQLGAVRREVLSSLHRRRMPFASGEAMVSFTFDDFPRSAYLAGGAILEDFGVRGTYYASAGLMNSSNDLGEHFRRDDLELLLGKGHELGSHTFGHTSARSVSCAGFDADVEKGRRALNEFAGSESGNFSYPFGHVTLCAKRIVAPQLASARGIYPGLNGPLLDLNLLRANALYGGMAGFRQASELIEENVRQRSWLIFYTHDVRPEPSRFGCTPEYLNAIVGAAASCGSRILTISAVLAEIGAQSGQKRVQSGEWGVPEREMDSRTMHFRDVAVKAKAAYPVNSRLPSRSQPHLTGSANEPIDSPHDAQAVVVHRDLR